MSITKERWAAIREQLQMAGRPTIASEVEQAFLKLQGEQDAAVALTEANADKIDDLQAQVTNLTQQLSDANEEISRLDALLTTPPKTTQHDTSAPVDPAPKG